MCANTSATICFFDEGDFLVNHIPVDIAIQSNLSGPYAILPQVARVLNRPDYIYWMDAYLDATVRQKIRRDGCLEEGEGYSIGYLNSNQDAAQNTHDYFLTRAATNSALLAISNRATIYNTTFAYGQGQWNTVSLPSGQLPSFGDTPFNNYFSSHSAGNSALLPAYGTLAIGAGSGSQAIQVNQNFSGDNNHMRADMNAFVLWAFNNEYLGNIRYYNGSIGRNFGDRCSRITPSRSIAPIFRRMPMPIPTATATSRFTSRQQQWWLTARSRNDGDRRPARVFQQGIAFPAVVADEYGGFGEALHGGRFPRHGRNDARYTFHGAIRWDQKGQCSFPLVTTATCIRCWRAARRGTRPTTRRITASGACQQQHRSGEFSNHLRPTPIVCPAATRIVDDADPQLSTNNYQLFLGTTPVPARDNTVPTNFFNSLNITRPSAIIRHRIPGGTLQDLFVSVIEPFNAGVSNIVSVTRLPMAGTANESVGLKITFKDGRVDTYIVNLRNPQIAGANTAQPQSRRLTANTHWSGVSGCTWTARVVIRGCGP